MNSYLVFYRLDNATPAYAIVHADSEDVARMVFHAEFTPDCVIQWVDLPPAYDVRDYDLD